MAINFPDTPTLGQTYPSPPVAGQPQYIWDGEKWTTVGVVAGSKTPVYTDGSTPMTAQLTVVTPPVAPTDAASKKYVDDTAVASLTAATPLDALSHNNLQINGAMEVSQENAANYQANLSNSNVHVVDMWRVQTSGVQVLNTGQSTLAPPGFTTSLEITIVTANPAPGAPEHCFALTTVEGYRIKKLMWGTVNAQPLTLAFWVRAGVAGVYSGSFRNAGNDTSYVFEFTVAVAGEFQYKVVTIPGPTVGAWPADNGPSAAVAFTLMAGAAVSTAPNVWTNGPFVASTGAMNGVTAGNTMHITGVVMLPGIVALTAARSPFLMRPADEELTLCQRYYFKTIHAGGYPGSTDRLILGTGAISNNILVGSFNFPHTMRTRPTVIISGEYRLIHGGTVTGLPSVVETSANYVSWAAAMPGAPDCAAYQLQGSDGQVQFISGDCRF